MQAMPIAIRRDPTCSISHTSTAANTPMVAKGVTTRRPSWMRSNAGTRKKMQSGVRTDLIHGSLQMAQLLKQNRDMAGSLVRVAMLADLHCTKTSQGAFQALFARV